MRYSKKCPLNRFCQNGRRKPATDTEARKGVRKERKSICRVKVVDQAVSLADPSFDISASLLNG